MHHLFTRFSNRAATLAGSSGAALLAFGLVGAWVVIGFTHGFTSHWYTVLSAAASAGSFVMVFLIQGAQARNTLALQVKIDELLRASGTDRIEMMQTEELDQRQLETLKEHYIRGSLEADRPSLDNAVGSLRR